MKTVGIEALARGSRDTLAGSRCWRRWCFRPAVARRLRGGGPWRHRGGQGPLKGLGVAGPLLIVALALIHAVVFYPAEIVDAAAGFVYGFFPALTLMMFGWLLSACSVRDRANGGEAAARPLAGCASASRVPRR